MRLRRVLSADPSLRVADEMALVTGDGAVETVVMRLNLATSAEDAALVMPTPQPATVTAAPTDLFDDLAELSAPRTETVRKFVIGLGGAAPSEGAMAGAPGSGPGSPTVLAQVRLGPLEATTLTGGDLAGVQKWLSDNGYQLRPEVSDGLDPYLRDGWSVVAMRLRADGNSLDGPLAPVQLTFASDELVYPMRMSSYARTPQTVTIYTLGPHRMQRTDADADVQSVTVDYAGSIDGRTDNAALTALAGPGAFLTKMTTTVYEPASITADFAFNDAPNDEPFQQVVYRYEYVNLTLVILGAVFLVVVAATVLVIVLLIRWVRRRPTAR